MDEGADLSFVPKQGTKVSCLIPWGRCRIDEVSMRFMSALYQYGRRKAGCLVLEDDLSRLVSLLVVKPSLRVEEQKIWYVFILQEPFPAGSYPLGRYEKRKLTALVLNRIRCFKPFRLEVVPGLGTGPEVCIDPHISGDQGCYSGGSAPTNLIACLLLTRSFITCLRQFLVRPDPSPDFRPGKLAV